MEIAQSQSTADFELENNMDALCLRIKGFKPEQLLKHHENVQKYYKKSNTRNKMFILLASLVNKHSVVQKDMIPTPSESMANNLVECNIEDIKNVIQKLFTNKGQLKINQLFIYMMLHKKHWISIFVEILRLLIVHNEQQLVELISHQPFVTFVWPAVLSTIWEHHNTHPSIFQLSRDAIQRCAHLNTSLFFQMEVALCRVEKFAEWLSSIEPFEKKPVQAAHALQIFSKHSVLHIVNEYLNLHVDNIGRIRQYVAENTEPDSWQVNQIDAYSILYHTALLLIDSTRLTQEAFARQLQEILKTSDHSLPCRSRLEIAESILSLIFLKRDDLKHSPESNKMNHEFCKVTKIDTIVAPATRECKEEEIERTITNDVNFVVNNVDKLRILTSMLQTYLTLDDIQSDLTQKSRQLGDNLEEISWKTSAIQCLTSKAHDSSKLGDHLFGRTSSDVVVSKAEACPVSLMLSSAQDFASYCIMKDDFTQAVNIIERYNLEHTEEGKQIFSMKHYDSLVRSIANAPPPDTHQVALREVDSFLALCGSTPGGHSHDESAARLATLADVLSSVAMHSNESEQLLAVILDGVESCEVNLTNFPTLLAHLRDAQSELSQCIRDDLVPPSTTLVDFVASGSSHMNLLFWRSLESLLKVFSLTEPRRLEEHFVMLVNLIKQSPYLDLDRSETDEMKPFSSRVQKMFLYLSSIECLVSNGKGNLLHCVDQNLTNKIGESLFTRNEPIASLDLPFVNLAYHAVNYCTGNIPLKRTQECLSELIVLNQCDPPQTATPTPCTLPAEDTVRDLLSSLLSQFEPHKVINVDLATRVLHNGRTRSVVMATCSKLARLDLGRYMRGEDATVFLINLYNLMWVHALLTLETSDKRTGLVSRSATCRFLTKRLVAYHLGQAGPVTLHHIEVILLHNFTPVFGTLVDPDASSPLCSTERLDNPLAGWNVTRDPRTVFVLGNAFLLSPLIGILSVEDNLDLTLEGRMSQYAAQHISLAQNRLHIPSLVCHYLEYVTSIARPECEHSNSSDTSSNQSRETRVALIEFVKDYTPIRSFILSRKDVHVLDDISFNIQLGYGDQSSSAVTSLTKDDVIRIDRHIVDYVADNDSMLGGILASLAKVNSITATATPSKLSKDKSKVLSPPVDPSQHKTSFKIADRLEQLCSKSRRVKLLSLLTPGKSPLICLLNWNVNLEDVWTTIEQEMGRGNFVLVLEIFYYVLSPRVFMEDVRLRSVYDTVLLELASTCDSYILDVTSLPTMADFILNNPHVSSLKCLQYLAARSQELDPVRAASVDRQFFLTKLNHEITETCALREWSITEDSDPYEILKKIIHSQDVDLAQRWCVYRNLPNEGSPDLEVLELYVVFLLDTQQATLAEDLCNALSTSQLGELCSRLICSACDVTHVKVIVNHALSRCTEQSGEDYERYMCTVIGVDMLSLMSGDDQKLYRHLISSPYLLIEQLLLLTRLSLLDKILAYIKPYLMPTDAIADKIPAGRLVQSEIDALLRAYATKALDFRICDVTCSKTVLLRSDKFATSFYPPHTPPSKEHWIPNDECSQCMVCKVTIFSMFNRRHHCRRCGRLVCGACSDNRMKVAGYGSVAVRVCTQCHTYASPRTLQLQVTCLTPAGEGLEQPLIFRNSPAHNATIRDEFSYEFAPSVSLCLSILKFHSQNTTLAMYLCETCTALLHVMKPSSREIDYSFVIRMIKCLVLACKVIYDVHGVESATLDEICTQVNLLSILVNNNCCHLIPEKPLVGQNALRQLRDSLLKEERWSLALEVSTKAGLDYNSVWTVWGKACLRAGAWTEARNIFAKCHFDKRENSTLIDILQILQNDIHNGADLSSRLSRLKSPPSGTATEQTSYSECLYYLHTYGSDALILTFYIHRESLRQALDHVRNSRVSPELFVEHVFLRCLKLGMTDSLYSLMEETDASLLVWRHYLRAVCSHCERQGLLHSLYAIQIRTRDPARAAITCVLFYLREAHCYAQLSEKGYQLARAREHLNDYRAQKTKLENHLAMHISPSELNKQLVLLDYQHKLVGTLVSSSQQLANRTSSKVATLFGGVDEKARLLADVLSLEHEGESEGRYRNLCKEAVSALGLNPVSIYSELVKALATQGRVQDIKNLAVSEKQSLGSSFDDILVAAIRQNPPQVEQLICLVSKIPLQISLFTEAGKLKSAYLLSIRHNRLDDIRVIASRAKTLKQASILNICLKKLALEEAKKDAGIPPLGHSDNPRPKHSRSGPGDNNNRLDYRNDRTSDDDNESKDVDNRPSDNSGMSIVKRIHQTEAPSSSSAQLTKIRIPGVDKSVSSALPSALRTNQRTSLKQTLSSPEKSKRDSIADSRQSCDSIADSRQSRDSIADKRQSRDSIAFVLKMYEQNRMRESQMVEATLRPAGGSKSLAGKDPSRSQRSSGSRSAQPSKMESPSGDRFVNRVSTSSGGDKSSAARESPRLETTGPSSKQPADRTVVTTVEASRRLPSPARQPSRSATSSPRPGTSSQVSTGQSPTFQTGLVSRSPESPSSRKSP